MPTACPCERCDASYDCDACLDAHLRTAHGATYTGTFGASPEDWIGVCDAHRRVPVARLGGVEPVTPRVAQAV